MEKEGIKMETHQNWIKQSKTNPNPGLVVVDGGNKVGEEMGLFRKMISGEKRVSMISF